MLKHKQRTKILSRLTQGIVLMLLVGSANAQLNTAVQTAVNTNKAAAKTQSRIDKLNDQTGDIVGRYRNVINEVESLRAYNKQLKSVVNDQRLQIENINNEMTHLEQTNRGVVPMIIEMVDALGKLIEADIPFKKKVREERLAKLESILNTSSVTTAEKYRKVTEAYTIELDYGSTVEAYGGTLPGTSKKVQFLRIGRASLIYQTLDQEHSGWYNPNTGKFEELDRKYNGEIKDAIRVAKNEASPQLVGLPVLGAQTAGGK